MPPLERYFKLPEQKRDQLVAAARAEFAAHGFERASLNRIIEASQISKGAMYYYFADKADLFGEVIDRVGEELLDRVGPLREARDAEDFWTALSEWARAATASLLVEPDLAALGRCLWGDGSTQQTVARLREQVHAMAAATLERGRALDAVRDDVPIDMLASGLTYLVLGLDRWFSNHFDELTAEEIERLSNKTLELCRDLANPRSRREESQA